MAFAISPDPPFKAPPLIKWPGGKRALLKNILPLLPVSANRYYEPFLGGAALFFAIQPRRSVLADTNKDLINLYRQVRDFPDELISILRKLKNSEADYYHVREQTPRNPLRRAARLLYLTNLSFNGIHRVNREGQFNVPYGRRPHRAPFDEDKIFAASRAFSGATLEVGDFEATTASAAQGDLVYFDPPYTVAHGQNGFLKYNERIFSWEDQERLSKHARLLTERGCAVLISNADHFSVRKLYRDFNVAKIDRFSRIAASAQHRRPITETIYYKYSR